MCAVCLIASLYGRVAAERRTLSPRSDLALQAATVAARLNPWVPRYRVDLAWNWGLRGDRARMEREILSALRLAPGHPYLWMEYAQLRAQARRLDERYDHSVQRAQALAPNSLPVRLAMAQLGARYWAFGSEAQRAEWARSQAYVLRRNPAVLLGVVLQDRREGEFCSYSGVALGLDDWCLAMRWMRAVCDGEESGTARVRDACHKAGIVPGRSGG